MRVLHLYKTYLPENFTGIPRVIHTLATTLAPAGVESEVLALSPRPAPAPLSIDGHRVHQARQDLFVASTGLSLSVIPAFRRLARAADILHYHFPWPVADALHLAFGRGRPAVVTYHSDIVRQKRLARLHAPLMHRFLERVDAIIATSPDYAATSPVLARHRDRVEVIPIGLPPRTPPEAGRVARWRAELGAGFMLFVGAARYYKGLEFLRAAAALTPVPIVLAGEGDPGPLPAGMRHLGPVSDADREALLELCAGLVLPSHLRAEAFGIVLAEAARAGRAMISCAIGTGTSFVNRDGETGFVVPPADPAALAEAMTRLAGDPALAARMGAAARRRFEALFTAEAMGAAHLALYRRLASSTSARIS